MSNQEIADIMWGRLVEAFNAEAATYDEKVFNSKLGSIGPVDDREVCRPDWWRELGGDEFIEGESKNRQLIVIGKGAPEGFDDYWEITHLIENAHDGEQLSTGTITFGS